jgi:hypothetical protein
MENSQNRLTPLALFGFIIVGNTAFNLAAVASVRAHEDAYFLNLIDGSEISFAGAESEEFQKILTQFERHARFGGLPQQPSTLLRPQ